MYPQTYYSTQSLSVGFFFQFEQCAELHRSIAANKLVDKQESSMLKCENLCCFATFCHHA